MAIIARGGGGVNMIASPGLKPAVCCDVVDMGFKDNPYQPGMKQHKISIRWLIAETIPPMWKHPYTGEQKDTGELAGKNFMVMRRFTNSLHEKATLRKLIEGWRGRKFTDGEDFEMSKLLGQPALLNLIESEGGYTNIDSVSRLPHGMSPIEPAGDLMIFSLDEPDWSVYEKLHDKLQEKIAQAPEFSGSKREPTAPHYVEEQPAPSATDQYAKLRSRPTGSGAPLPQAAAPPTRPAPPTEFNDDIPF